MRLATIDNIYASVQKARGDASEVPDSRLWRQHGYLLFIARHGGSPLQLDHSGVGSRGSRATLCHRVSWECVVIFRELDTVVLERDVPENGLRKGDISSENAT